MDEQDEELPTGGPSRKRLRIDLTIGAVLLLGVLVALRLTSGHSKAAGKASPTPTPSVSTPVGGYGTGAPDPGSGLLNGMSTCDPDAGYCSRLVVVSPGATATVNPSGGWIVFDPTAQLPQRTAADPGACPWPTGANGEPGCTESKDIPRAAVDAIRAVFPNARVVSAETVRLVAGPIWFRQVNASIDGADLVIRVEAPPSTGMPRAGTSAAPGGITVASGAQPPYYLYAQLDQPGQGAALAKLLKDPLLTG